MLNKNGIKVLSLFDGISGCQVALKNLNIKVDLYFSSEIDKYAIKVCLANFPNTIQLGDVTKINKEMIGCEIDLMTWGSPCQDLSIAKKNRQGLKGQRSGLFWDAVRLWKEIKPKYWIMENVASMSKEDCKVISMELGVSPIMINSALVTAQQRKRYYWTNIKGFMLDGSIGDPEDKGILLKDVLEVLDCEKLKSYSIRSSGSGSGLDDPHNWDSCKIQKPQSQRIYDTEGKSVCLQAGGGGAGAKTGLYACALRTYPRIPNGEPRSKVLEFKDDGKANSLTSVQTDSMIQDDFIVRKLTPMECERLQGFPEIKKHVILNIWNEKYLDLQKNYVNAENKNLKLLKYVGNVEKDKSQENVLYVKHILNIKNQQIKRPVVKSVHIFLREGIVQKLKVGKKIINVLYAENQKQYHLVNQIIDFVHQSVGINTIQAKIQHHGKEELQKKEQPFIIQKNGKILLNIFGNEIMQHASVAEKDVIILLNTISTISNLLDIKNYEQTLKTLFCYVKSAIDGYIQKEIKNTDILRIKITTLNGYTQSVSNTQRYKCLGNSFTVPVIEHILSHIPKGDLYDCKN